MAACIAAACSLRSLAKALPPALSGFTGDLESEPVPESGCDSSSAGDSVALADSVSDAFSESVTTRRERCMMPASAGTDSWMSSGVNSKPWMMAATSSSS